MESNYLLTNKKKGKKTINVINTNNISVNFDDDQNENNVEVVDNTNSLYVSDTIKNLCIHHITKKCINGANCNLKHIENNNLFTGLHKVLTEPLIILSDNNKHKNEFVLLVKFIKKMDVFKDFNGKIIVNTCFHSLKGFICNNSKCGRCFDYSIIFNGETVPINICYSDNIANNKCVVFSIHYDVVYSYMNDKFTVINFKSLNEPKFNINNDKKIADFNENSYPELVKSSNDNVSDSKKEIIPQKVFPTFVEKVEQMQEPMSIQASMPMSMPIDDSIKKKQKLYFMKKEIISNEYLYSNVDVSSLNSKSNDELIDIISTLVKDNNELYHRITNMFYANRILSIPMMRYISNTTSNTIVDHDPHYQNNQNNQTDTIF